MKGVRGGSEAMDAHDRSSAPIVHVRRATPNDLMAMARVHVETWKSAYRGLGFDDRLDQLTVETDLARGFGRWLANPLPGMAQFVAVTSADEVVGFAMGRPNREPDPEYTGELGSIYVLPFHQGRGVGSTLLRRVVDHLTDLGHRSMLAWVLEENPYRRFYERLGGNLVQHRVAWSRTVGTDLPKVSYGWKDITRLA